jgi:hypothetical protein
MISITKYRNIYFTLLPIILVWYLLIWNSNALGNYITPILLLVLISFLGFVVISGKCAFTEKKDDASHTLWLFGAWFSVATILFFFAVALFEQHPIDISKSDIIPLIEEVYYTRWIQGSFVYADVKGYDYIHWVPNYLPLHWMPFIPAYFFHFDPRLVPLVLFFFVQFLYVRQLNQLDLSLLEKISKATLPLLFLASIMYHQKQSFAHTIELLVVSYYLILTMGMFIQKKAGFIIGSITTLLSRYMSVFFLPIHFIYQITSATRKTIYIYVVIISAIILIYVFPFISIRPGLFFEGAAAYDLAALGEWKGQYWQASGDKPYQLSQGYGFAAIYFQAFQSFELLQRIQILKYSMLLVMCVNILFWWWMRKRIKTDDNIALPIILMITLALFLSFVTVPYNYLFWNLLFLLPVISMRIRWFN